jgi:hypothetical protein
MFNGSTAQVSNRLAVRRPVGQALTEVPIENRNIAEGLAAELPRGATLKF